mgnify:CR=1 FL=1
MRHLFVYTMSQVQICACTRICIWRMYITWLLSEMVYKVYESSRSQPARLYKSRRSQLTQSYTRNKERNSEHEHRNFSN